MVRKILNQGFFDAKVLFIFDGLPIGRLVNHSKDNPNCKTKTVYVNGQPRLILLAKNDISNGTELLFDYGERALF